MKLFEMFGDVLINDKASKTLGDIGKNVVGFGKTLTSGLVTTAKWGAGIAASFGVAMLPAVNFQKEMSNVATLLDGAVDEKIKMFGDNLKQLSLSANVSTSKLTDGLYQVISAVGETSDSMDILETAAKGAKAGNATVTDSVNLLSAVMKGYGDVSIEAANKASDLAFQTVKLGQTSFPELAASMGKVIPLAGTLKVSQEELFGATATLTGVTGNTAEVMTQLRAIMQSALKPSEDMSESLKQMGYETGAAAVESEGLDGFLKGLLKSVDGNEVAFANLFPSVEASTAALALTGAQAENFTSKTKEMSKAMGATEDAFKKQNDNLASTVSNIKNYANVMLINIGEKVLPILNKMLKWFLEKMPDIEKTFNSLISKSIDFAIDFLKSINSVLESLKGWLKTNDDTLGMIAKTFNVAIEFIKDKVKKGLSFITGLWNDNSEDIKRITLKAMELIEKTFINSINFIKGLWEKFAPDIKKTLDNTMPIIEKVIKDTLKLIENSIDLFTGIIDGDFTKVKESFLKIIEPIEILIPLIAGLTAGFVTYKAAVAISSIISAVTAAFAAMNVAVAAQGGLMAALNTILLANPFVAVAVAVGALVTAIVLLWQNWDKVSEAVKKAFDVIKNLHPIQGLVDVIYNLNNAIISAIDIFVEEFGGLWEKTSESFNNLTKNISLVFVNLTADMIEAGGNIIIGLGDGIMAGKDAVIEKIKGVGSDVISGFKEMLGINSPSKVFSDFGGFILEGLTRGIANGLATIKETAANLGTSFLDGFKDLMGIHSESTEMVENGGFIIEGLVSGVVKNLDQVQAANEKLINTLQEMKEPAVTNAAETGKEVGETLVDGIVKAEEKAAPKIGKSTKKYLDQSKLDVLEYEEAYDEFYANIKEEQAKIQEEQTQKEKEETDKRITKFQEYSTLAIEILGKIGIAGDDMATALTAGVSLATDVMSGNFIGAANTILTQGDTITKTIVGMFAGTKNSGKSTADAVSEAFQDMADKVGSVVSDVVLFISDNLENTLGKSLIDTGFLAQSKFNDLGISIQKSIKQAIDAGKNDFEDLTNVLGVLLETGEHYVIDFAEETKRILQELTNIAISEADKLGEAIITALTNRYEAERDAEMARLDESIANQINAKESRLNTLKSERDQAIQLINDKYNAKIDSINEETSEELRLTDEKFIKKKSAIDKELQYELLAIQAKTDENAAALLQELDDLYSSQSEARAQQEQWRKEEQEARLEANYQKLVDENASKEELEKALTELFVFRRDLRIEELEANVSSIVEEGEQKKAELQKTADDEVAILEEKQKKQNLLTKLRAEQRIKKEKADQKELIEKQEETFNTLIQQEDDLYDEKINNLESYKQQQIEFWENQLSEQNLQNEALLLAEKENQDDTIALLETYYPEWQNVGQSFGEKLINGLNSTKQSIANVVAEVLGMVGTVEDASNITLTPPTSTPNPFAGRTPTQPATGSGTTVQNITINNSEPQGIAENARQARVTMQQMAIA